MISLDRVISIVARYWQNNVLGIGVRLAQGSSPYPKCGDGLATAAMAETIPVDANRDQWREAAGDEEDDPETQGGRAG